MPDIPYRFSKFTGNWPPNGRSSLIVTWEELAWAAILVGKPDLNSVLQFGQESILEACWRACLLLANLREDGQGSIVRSDAFRALDPTEKGAVTYFLGIAVAKVFADRILGVPYLRHVRALIDSGVVAIPGNRAPDLAGPTTGDDWLVIEAKGRTRAVGSGVMDAAKKQAQLVTSVNGKPPWLTVATGMGLSKRLDFQMQDPAPARKRMAMTVSEPDWLRAYYEPVVAAIRHGNTEPAPGKQTRVQLPLADVSLRLPSKLSTLLRSDEPITRVKLRERIPESVAPADKGGAARIPRDGITVDLGESWTTSRLTKAVRHSRKQ